MRLKLVIIILIFSIIKPCYAQGVDQTTNSTRDTAQLGKQLFSDIEQKYQALRKEGATTLDRVDISAIIVKYIPIGTSFKDAENILVNAGFSLAPSPPRPKRVNDHTYFRFSIRGGMTLDKGLACKTEAWIILSPEKPGSLLNKVSKVSGGINTSCL
jgi:hypothetical protein